TMSPSSYSRMISLSLRWASVLVRPRARLKILLPSGAYPTVTDATHRFRALSHERPPSPRLRRAGIRQRSLHVRGARRNPRLQTLGSVGYALELPIADGRSESARR